MARARNLLLAIIGVKQGGASVEHHQLAIF
uniref:Uncharacterized protein n=1 Tax=Mycobacterium riyadhense TaxID=486698 RepID=A0A653EXM2_9MYCO|nr:hypothetical protein BIN_B_04013 [Mycobacterium riyadhense]